jgi:hypothetical protein
VAADTIQLRLLIDFCRKSCRIIDFLRVKNELAARMDIYLGAIETPPALSRAPAASSRTIDIYKREKIKLQISVSIITILRQ